MTDSRLQIGAFGGILEGMRGSRPHPGAAVTLGPLTSPAGRRRRSVRWWLAPPALAVVLGLVFIPVAAIRGSQFSTGAATLRAEWERDVHDGVPAPWIAPLRSELSAYSSPGIAGLGWWHDWPAGELSSLERRTAALRQRAMVSARSQLQTEMTAAQGLLGSMDPATGAQWQARLQSIGQEAVRATSPAAVTALVGPLRQAEQDEARTIAAARLAASGGVDGITATVRGLDAVAATKNLDATVMDAALARLAAEVGSAGPQPATITAVLDSITEERGAIAVNDEIAARLRPLLYELDEASVLGAPDAASMQATYSGIGPAWTAARTRPALLAVEATVQALTDRSGVAIDAARCGHGTGRSILVSLSLQELVAFQDGCAVQATPVTTGRPALPTPSGHFSVFFKTSPWEMVSSWPPGSPFWYPPTWVDQVMEFASGGYFLHDAAWEPTADYGPGGEYSPTSASHGCIHVPTPAMHWLYGWTPVGTPVTIVA